MDNPSHTLYMPQNKVIQHVGETMPRDNMEETLYKKLEGYMIDNQVLSEKNHSIKSIALAEINP